MAKHKSIRSGGAALLLAIVLQMMPLHGAFGAPPAELLDVSDGMAYGEESLPCPDCGCEMSGAASRHGARCARCCCGRDVCCPTVEEVTEERSCWKVSCEKVCVPAIRLPWEPGGSKLTLFSWLRPHSSSCHCSRPSGYDPDCDACASRRAAECAPKCGPVRSISVLEPESYEVKVCRCKWDIRTIAGCCQQPCCAPGDEVIPVNSQAVEEGDLPAPLPQP